MKTVTYEVKLRIPDDVDVMELANDIRETFMIDHGFGLPNAAESAEVRYIHSK